jgi:hypothetical protein
LSLERHGKVVLRNSSTADLEVQSILRLQVRSNALPARNGGTGCFGQVADSLPHLWRVAVHTAAHPDAHDAQHANYGTQHAAVLYFREPQTTV